MKQMEIALLGIRSLTIEGWATDIRGVFKLERLGEHLFCFTTSV
jgi:hypothetical protein